LTAFLGEGIEGNGMEIKEFLKNMLFIPTFGSLMGGKGMKP
jgi:hypothetical protein